MNKDVIKTIESEISKAKEAIKAAEKSLNKAITEQMSEAFITVGEEILRVVLKHLDWYEDYKDVVFDSLEIKEGRPCFTVIVEYRQKK